MGELHSSMEELLRDKDGDYSEARILSTVRQLQREGRKTRSIARAMLRAMIEVSGDLDPTRDTCFLRHARDVLDESITLTNRCLLEMRDGSPPH